MTTTHRLSGDAFAALASGTGGTDAIEELTAAELSKHIILLQGVVQVAGETKHHQHALARQGYELLATAMRENQRAAERVIRHPPVAVWARRTILACRDGVPAKRAEPAQLCAVGAAAAIQSGLAATIDVPAIDGRVMLPSLGEAMVPGDSALVRVGPSGMTVGPVEIPPDPGWNAPGWTGLRRIRAGALDFLIDDRDPYRMPDLTDLASSAPISRWEGIFHATWPLLAAHHLNAAAEIARTLTVVVPRAQPRSHTISTSSSEAFGTIAMSLPPDPVACAETLVHEVQHLKLGAIQDLVRLTMPDDGSRYYAPWRNEPRPVSGLLQGTYAYLGVSGFWRRQREFCDDPILGHAEYARWRDATAAAVRTLQSSGQLTPAGIEFADGMARTLHGWRHEQVPPDAIEQAHRAAWEHRSRWEAAHGPIPSA